MELENHLTPIIQQRNRLLYTKAPLYDQGRWKREGVDFEILYFAFAVLVEKWFSLCFELAKLNFSTVGIPGKNTPDVRGYDSNRVLVKCAGTIAFVKLEL